MQSQQQGSETMDCNEHPYGSLCAEISLLHGMAGVSVVCYTLTRYE